jgi:hypothetical protein
MLAAPRLSCTAVTANPFYAGRMSRRGADEISGSPEPQARLLRASGPSEMSAEHRDHLIIYLSGRGWNDSKIAHAVGLSRRGVAAARARIAEGRPGRVRAE